MGFYSWITQDTNRSISNVHSGRPTFRVHMIDNEGNVWTEDNYEGYGVFGGKDFFELLAEMNCFESDRDIGIDIYCNWEPNTFYSPTLAENKDCEWIGTPPLRS